MYRVVKHLPGHPTGVFYIIGVNETFRIHVSTKVRQLRRNNKEASMLDDERCELSSVW